MSSSAELRRGFDYLKFKIEIGNFCKKMQKKFEIFRGEKADQRANFVYLNLSSRLKN